MVITVQKGTMMNKIKIHIFIVILSFFFACNSCAENNDLLELNTLANKLRNAILNNDLEFVSKFINPSGMYFGDSVYTSQEIRQFLKDENSWLYKHLFGKKDSVKSFFINANDIKIKIYYRGDDAYHISFQSSNYDPTEWMECCFIRIKGTLFFDGIFSCD
jgi:hypothetical protein